MGALILDKVSTVGVSGADHVVGGVPAGNRNHTFELFFNPTETPTAISLDIEGAIGLTSNGVTPNFYNLATVDFTAAELAAKRTLFFLNSVVVERVRITPRTITGVATLSGIYSGTK